MSCTFLNIYQYMVHEFKINTLKILWNKYGMFVNRAALSTRWYVFDRDQLLKIPNSDLHSKDVFRFQWLAYWVTTSCSRPLVIFKVHFVLTNSLYRFMTCSKFYHSVCEWSRPKLKHRSLFFSLISVFFFSFETSDWNIPW